MVSFDKSKDLYKMLEVPRTATITEIKASYRKLALRLHPDKHNDDPRKTEQFKTVSEAYAILSNVDKRNSYDSSLGIRYNKNRRTAPPPNYRTVVFPKPPKDWKMVWDHQLHYDMHYGDGMYEEITRQIKKRAEKNGGPLTYQSPLGKGFSFSKTNHNLNHNPYSRSTPQGPPKIIYEYEEAYVDRSGSKQQNQHRFVHIVEDLHGRREQRRAYQSQRSDSKTAKSKNAAFEKNKNGAGNCFIL